MDSPNCWIVSATIFSEEAGSRRSAFMAMAEEPLPRALIFLTRRSKSAALPVDVYVIETFEHL
jgi:hypothetical protein